MATKLKVNYEFVGDSTTPVTRTNSIKHGDNMLDSVVSGIVTSLGTKAEKSYTDNELIKKADKSIVMSHYVSEFSGNNDTEKFQNALNSGKCVVLSGDISIGSVNFTNRFVYIFGNGNKITLNGVFSSTAEYGQEYWFENIEFNGNGGYFDLDFNKMVNVRFLNCSFKNFNHDIFVGKLQGVSFENCFFNYNSGFVINASRLDAVWFDRCNIEGGKSFMKADTGYGVSVRDTVIESLTDTAFEIKGFGNCNFDTLYMEGNLHNFVIYADYVGNIVLHNIHCNVHNSNPVLVEAVKSNLNAPMYGYIDCLHCSVNTGKIVKLNDTLNSYKINCESYAIGADTSTSIEAFDKSGVTSKAELFLESTSLKTVKVSVTGTFSESGSWLNLKNLGSPAAGHNTIGMTICAMDNSRFPYPNSIPFISGDNFLLYGDGTTEYTYDISILYT